MCYRTRDVEIAELRGAVAALAARVVALERAVREKSLVSDTANSRRFLIAIAEIVKGHGGEIKVESESGQGTCFTVELPGVLTD